VKPAKPEIFGAAPTTVARFALITFLAVLLASCAVNFTQVQGSDGKRQYVMRCAGLSNHAGACNRLARQLCRRGYHFVNDTAPTYSSPARPQPPYGQRDYWRIECN
jgi:hypothetical protein